MKGKNPSLQKHNSTYGIQQTVVNKAVFCVLHLVTRYWSTTPFFDVQRSNVMKDKQEFLNKFMA